MQKSIAIIAVVTVLSLGGTIEAAAIGHKDGASGAASPSALQMPEFSVLTEGRASAGGLVDGPREPVNEAQSLTSLVALQRGNPSLVQAGEALQRFRTLYYVGWGLQLTGALLWVAGGGALSLLGGVVAAAGSVMQFIAFWQVGAAGELLIQAGR